MHSKRIPFCVLTPGKNSEGFEIRSISHHHFFLRCQSYNDFWTICTTTGSQQSQCGLTKQAKFRMPRFPCQIGVVIAGHSKKGLPFFNALSWYDAHLSRIDRKILYSLADIQAYLLVRLPRLVNSLQFDNQKRNLFDGKTLVNGCPCINSNYWLTGNIANDIFVPANLVTDEFVAIERVLVHRYDFIPITQRPCAFKIIWYWRPLNKWMLLLG